jgi:hypothetical protein
MISQGDDLHNEGEKCYTAVYDAFVLHLSTV